MSCWHRRLKNTDSIEPTKNIRRQSVNESSLHNTVAASSFPNRNEDSDKQAVGWWRSLQHDNVVIGSNDVVSKKEHTDILSIVPMQDKESNKETNPPTTTTPPFNAFGSNQFFSEKERPNDTFDHKIQKMPQNGMVLDPSLLPKETKNTGKNPSLGIFQTRGRSESDDGIEFFLPQVVPASPRKQEIWQSQAENQNSLAPSRTRGIFDTNDLGNTEKDDIILDGSILTTGESKASSVKGEYTSMMEFSDHLSDVPSDVDSITRERYLLACQMLKMTIIQKESALIPIEREYILSLLDSFESRSVDDSDLSKDDVYRIEQAIRQLENDPTSITSNDTGNVDLPSPTTAARAQNILKTDGKTRKETMLSSRNDKHPHTATRKAFKFMEQISNPCNQKKSTKTSAQRKDLHDQEVVIIKDNDLSDSIEILSGHHTDSLLRFDGWSFQDTMEYPFLLLDADGNDMNPRVFTPAMMEALRGFMPLKVTDHNFWLRFSLARDRASFATLLASVRACASTLIGIETDRGEVFGSFTGSPWRIGRKWFGTSDAFLWRLKQKRYTSPQNARKPNFEREIEVYPCTNEDDLIQYCTAKTIAVGGGEWQYSSCPYGDCGQGIGLVIDGDLAGGETGSCATFANPQLARHASTSNEFVITNLEVWSLTPCANVEDATKTEMRELLVKGYEI